MTKQTSQKKQPAARFSLEQMESRLRSAKSILVTTHISPDADGLGSMLALAHILKGLKKKVHLVLESPLDARYSPLDKDKVIKGLDQLLNENGSFPFCDLVIVVDTNKISRTGLRMGQYLGSAQDLVFIDHHPYQRVIPGVHFIDTSAAATGEIIGQLALQLKVKLTREIALPLYTAILIDTNSFRYPSVTSDTHHLIAKLLEHSGVRPADAYNLMYGTRTLNHMKLLGHVLSHCEMNSTKNIAWIYIQEKTLEQYKVKTQHTYSYINNLLILDKIDIAGMFLEQGNRLKLSLRSHGQIDVGEIASDLGGGGHAHAAATTLEIPPQQSKEKVIKQTIKRIEQYLLASIS